MCIRDRHDLTGQDVNHLILGFVPMPKAGAGTGRQNLDKGAVLRQSARVGQKLIGIGAKAAAPERMRRIFGGLNRGQSDLRHQATGGT